MIIEETQCRIFGEHLSWYRFYRDDEPITEPKMFRNDDEAIDWFKEKYYDEYKRGAEMRCYD